MVASQVKALPLGVLASTLVVFDASAVPTVADTMLVFPIAIALTSNSWRSPVDAFVGSVLFTACTTIS